MGVFLKNKLPQFDDPLLTKLVGELIKKQKCHTVILYGSRARGDATPQSDYDLMGVRRSGNKFRIAEKRQGLYSDIFVYPEKDLKKVGEDYLYMNGGKVLYQKGNFGTTFLEKLKSASKRKYKPLPSDEIQTRKVWLHKMFDRIALGDIEGNYRRSWLHEALLADYFHIRKKRYLGSKQSFAWLKKHDPETYSLFDEVLQNPLHLSRLKALVEKVSGHKK
jgi:hypothetical protein